MNVFPIALALVSAGATLTGGVVALRVHDRLHLVLGAVAGVVLGVVLFELLPEALEGYPGLIFGVPGPLLTLAAGGTLVVHSTTDGLSIGLAFQGGAAVGTSVAIAVIAHDFADAFNTFTITRLYGNSRRRALTLLGMDSVAPIAGALLGSLITVPGSVLALYLGFFGGLLLYISTSDILPEAHASHPSRLTLLCTVSGIAFVWLVAGL